jgi:hypothetical protein
MAAPLLSSDALDRFAMASRLGAAIARPFALLGPDSCALGPVPLAGLARFPAFLRPLEKALAAARRPADGFTLSAEAIHAALNTAEGRLGVLLAAEPLPAVRRAALHCAAAAMQKQILGVVQKAERQRLRAAIGAENHLVATQEAPTLFPALAGLGSDAVFREALGLEGEAALAERLADHGLSLLHGLLALRQPAFAKLFAARLPQRAKAGAASADVAPHARQLVKFIRRRMPGWSDIIG